MALPSSHLAGEMGSGIRDNVAVDQPGVDCWGLAPESRPPGLVQAKRKKALDCLVALSVRQELVGSSTFAAMARLRPTAAGSP